MMYDTTDIFLFLLCGLFFQIKELEIYLVEEILAKGMESINIRTYK